MRFKNTYDKLNKMLSNVMIDIDSKIDFFNNFKFIIHLNISSLVISPFSSVFLFNL